MSGVPSEISVSIKASFPHSSFERLTVFFHLPSESFCMMVITPALIVSSGQLELVTSEILVGCLNSGNEYNSLNADFSFCSLSFYHPLFA